MFSLCVPVTQWFNRNLPYMIITYARGPLTNIIIVLAIPYQRASGLLVPSC